MKKEKVKPNSGFSLIETMVVIGIFLIIFSFGLVFTLNSYRSYSFNAEITTIVSVLEKARSRALTNLYQSPHGVCFISSNYVIFRGTTCTPGAPTNELVSASKKVFDASNFSTTFPTIVFEQLSGTTTGGTITVTDGTKTTTIVINNEGRINW